MRGERIGWIDALRALGAMAVTMIHVISMWVSDANGGGTGPLARGLLDRVLLQVLIRWAVPCFLMISGYLLLDPAREFPVEKAKRYAARMLAVLATFGFSYCLFDAFLEGGVSLSSVAAAALNLCTRRSWVHMWYVYAAVGLYLLTPMLRAYSRASDERTARFTVGVLFVCNALLPTVGLLFEIELETFVPVASYCLFYYLAGDLVRRFGIARGRALRMAALGAAGFAASMVWRMLGGSVEQSGDNVFAAIYSVGLFALAKDSALLDRLAGTRPIRRLARCSFGIYLMHPILLQISYRVLRVFPNALPIGVGEAAFFAASLLSAWLLTEMGRRVPGLRRMLG